MLNTSWVITLKLPSMTIITIETQNISSGFNVEQVGNRVQLT